MKRCLLLFPVVLGLLQSPVQGQDAAAAAAAALADKQAAEERYSRMAADIEALQAANTALQNKIDRLVEQLEKAREEQSKAANKDETAPIREDLKRLAEKIQEVDKKRESDKELINEELSKAFNKLAEKIAAAPLVRTPVKPAKTEPAEPALPDRGYTHVVESGDTLSGIVEAYNAQFKSKGMKQITMKQVSAANPKVNWNRLKVGQKIIVPAP